MKSFQGKRVLITGASSGIGWQTALDFASEGAPLLLVARRQQRLLELAQEIRQKGAQAEVFVCDLSDYEARIGLIEEIKAQIGVPDVLINNAGFGNFRPFVREPFAEIVRMMRLNYEAAAHLMAAFLPEMIQRGSGAVVNISSGAGKVALPGMAAYCASKFALCALTESVYYETQNTGVSVHLINPGPVETEFFGAGVWDGRPPLKKATAQQVSEAIQKAILRNRFETYVPGLRRYIAYAFNVLKPLGRWVMVRKAANLHKL
ncbi:MAG: SDR family oxidoreductase [bacterium]